MVFGNSGPPRILGTTMAADPADNGLEYDTHTFGLAVTPVTELADDEIFSQFTVVLALGQIEVKRGLEGTPVQVHQAGQLFYDIITASQLIHSATTTSTTAGLLLSGQDTTPLTHPSSSFYVTPPNSQSLAPTNTAINFNESGPPAEVEDATSLGVSIDWLVSYQGWYSTLLNAVVTKFKPNPGQITLDWDETNEICNLTIEAGVHSEVGDLTAQFAQPVNFIGGPDGAFGTTEDNYPKPPGYIPGSFDYGWGDNVVPPYDAWWVYPSSSNGGQSARAAGQTIIQPYNAPYGPLGVGLPGWLNRGDPTLETNVIDSMYGQLPASPIPQFVGVAADPFKADYSIDHDSVTTMRLHYTPGPLTVGSRVGISLMEISSRVQLGFGQILGSQDLHIWTWTTVDDDTINNFNPLFSATCGLNMDDIFLRVYVTTAGAVKFLYSADNVRFYTAFDFGTTLPYFRHGPARVGAFMFHLKSYPTFADIATNTDYVPQNGSLNCCHWDQFIGTVDPETYHLSLADNVYPL